MMRIFALSIVLTMVAVSASAQKAAEKPSCVSIEKAKDFIGQDVCVVGQVHRIGFSDSGTAFITFCEDYKNCPFTAVVFARDMDKAGNLQMFEGRELEVTGRVKDFHGTAEIVVKKRSQFSGEAISPSLGHPDTNPRSGNWHR
jgi:DNA/RNA endonuclease YhcR with UshA esterase domain